MRKNLLILSIIAFSLSINAQIVKLEQVHNIKQGKLIVELTSDEQINEWLKSAINECWTFSEVVDFTDAKSANERAKKEKDIQVLRLGKISSSSMKHTASGSNYSYRLISTGQYIGIGKVMVYIPTFEDDEITEEIIVYGVSTLHHMLVTMDTKELKSNMKLKDAYKEDTPELKDKVLYLAEGWLDKKFDIEEIPDMYDAKIKVVSYEIWRDAILNKEEGVAYCMVTPQPMGGTYVYMHYLVDAKTAKVLAIVYPKVSANILGVNVSKSNTGYINSKIIKMYNDALQGKW